MRYLEEFQWRWQIADLCLEGKEKIDWLPSDHLGIDIFPPICWWKHKDRYTTLCLMKNSIRRVQFEQHKTDYIAMGKKASNKVEMIN